MLESQTSTDTQHRSGYLTQQTPYFCESDISLLCMSARLSSQPLRTQAFVEVPQAIGLVLVFLSSSSDRKALAHEYQVWDSIGYHSALVSRAYT